MQKEGWYQDAIDAETQFAACGAAMRCKNECGRRRTDAIAICMLIL